MCAASCFPLPKLGFRYDKSTKNSNFRGQVVEIKSTFGNIDAHIQPPEEKPPCIPTEFGGIEDSIKWFTGRKNELDKLHQQIQASKSDQEEFTAASHVHVVSGISGVGKTQFVRNYIQKHKGEYDHVLWIKAETIGDARSCFVAIAKESNINITESNGILPTDKEIVLKIYNSPCIGRSLFIFDNLEDEGLGQDNNIQNFLPSSIPTDRIPPTIIVTTRHPNWKGFSSIHLEGLRDDECYELLTFSLKIKRNDENQQLAFKINEQFQGHPLALKHVMYMIQDEDEIRKLNGRRYSLKEFMEDWKLKETFKDTKPDHSDISVSICTLYDLAVQKLEGKTAGKLAINCLDLMAILDPDGIPRNLLTSLIDVSPELLLPAIKLLENSGLITSNDKAYQMHRVLQVVRKQQISSFTVLALSKLWHRPLNLFRNPSQVILLSKILKQYIKYMTHSAYWDTISALGNGLRLHKYCVANNINNGATMHKFGITLAHEFAVRFMHNEAEQICLSQLQAGFTKKQLRATRSVLYLNYWLAENPKEANKIGSAIVSDHKERFGPNHPKTLRWMSKSALMYKDQGKYEEAKTLYKAIFEKQRASNHPDALKTLCNLAKVYYIAGDTVQAENYFQQILSEVYRSSKTSNSYDILRDLADIFLDLEHFTKAEELFKEFIHQQKNAVSPHNLGVFLYSLARVYTFSEKYHDAELVYEQLLDDNKNSLGAAHYETLNILDKLVQSMVNQAKYLEAENLYQNIISEQQKILPAGDQTLLQTMGELGQLYKEQQKWAEGIQTYENILADQNTNLGENHGETVSTIEILVSLYVKAGKFDGAEKHYRRLIGEYKNVDSVYHYKLQSGIESLSDVYRNHGKKEEALSLLKDHFEEQLMSPENSDFRIRSTMAALVDVLLEEKSYDEIITLFRDWLEAFKPKRDAKQTIIDIFRDVYERQEKEFQDLEVYITQEEKQAKDVLGLLRDIFDFVSTQ